MSGRNTNGDGTVSPCSNWSIVSWFEQRVFAWSDNPTPKRFATDTLIVFLTMLLATVLGVIFYSLDMEACIVITYVLAVLCVSLLTVGRLHCLVASALAVLFYNFFFTRPRFSLTAWGRTYPATFVVMFVVAFIASAVAVTLRREVHASQLAYRRTQIILEADEALRRCSTREQIIDAIGAQLSKLLEAEVIWYAEGISGFAPQRHFSAVSATQTEPIVETPMARRAMENRGAVGAGTGCFPSASGYYLPVISDDEVIGVMGACLGNKTPLPAEQNEAEAVVGEASLALNRIQALEQREEAAVLAKNEQLRANLLRSISHDLRTPLTAISGNADVLLSDGDALSADKRAELLRDIRSDANWLNATVENLLAITRLENGNVQLNTTAELLDDIIEEALRHANPDICQHGLEIEPCEDLLLVKVDAKLIVQVVVNLVNNAVTHTQTGSTIRVSTCSRGTEAIVRVEDDGPGIKDSDKAHVFESFYTIGRALADSKRSVGLGLSLCKSIVEAHGGSTVIQDAVPHGCAFEFALPRYELTEGAQEDAD